MFAKLVNLLHWAVLTMTEDVCDANSVSEGLSFQGLPTPHKFVIL